MSALRRDPVDLAQRTTRALLGAKATGARKKSLPNVEHLERLLLLSTGCPVISGFVFLDQNRNPVLTNNGLFNPGELPIPGAQVELFDASNHLLATTTTDSHGAYSFDGLPNTTAKPVTLPAQTVTLNATLTPYANHQFTPSTLSLFDPDLGTLTGVTISHAANFNSTLNVTNPAPVPLSFNASATGNYQIQGLSELVSGAVNTSQGPFTLGAFDPNNPNANKTTVNLNASDTPPAVTLTSASALAFFTASSGHTTITPTMSATGESTVSGSGVDFTSTGSAGGTVTISYTYIPKKCIAPGKYTLVQTPNPPQLINGKESQPGVVFPAPPVGQPQKLSVTVNQTDLPDNDFAKLSAGNPNPNNNCPTPGKVVRFGVHHQPTQLVLNFVGPVNATLANNPNNYFVTTSSGAHIKIVSARFDPATNSVTLIPAHKLNIHLRYDLSVNLPCTGNCNTVVIPFGGKMSLGGFTNHQGQFVPVVNGVIPRGGHHGAVLGQAHA